MKSLFYGIVWGVLALMCVLLGYYKAASLYVLAVFLLIIALTHLSAWTKSAYSKSSYAKRREIDSNIIEFVNNKSQGFMNIYDANDELYREYRHQLKGYENIKVTYFADDRMIGLERCSDRNQEEVQDVAEV